MLEKLTHFVFLLINYKEDKIIDCIWLFVFNFFNFNFTQSFKPDENQY